MGRKRSTKIEPEIKEEVKEEINEKKKDEVKTTPQTRRRSRPTKKISIFSKLIQKISMKNGLFMLLIIVIILIFAWVIISDSEDSEEMNLEGYDVRISSLNPYHEIDNGNSTDFILIVKNTGEVKDTLELSVHGKPNDWEVNFDKNNKKIDSKKSFVSILSVKINDLKIGKNISLGVVVTSKSNPSKQDSMFVYLEIVSFKGERAKNEDAISVDYIGCYATNGTIFDTSLEAFGKNDNLKFTKEFDESRKIKEYNWLDFTISKGDLFYMDLDLKKHLKEGTVTEEIQDGFKDHKYTISSKATITKKGEKKWDLTDGETTFVIENTGDFLSVYDTTQMIKGFDDAVVGMKVGDSLVTRIPPGHAYGESGESSHNLAGETLIFEIILRKIE